MSIRLRRTFAGLAVGAALILGAAAPAIAETAVTYGITLPAGFIETDVASGYHYSSYSNAWASITSGVDTQFWIDLPGVGQASQSVDISAGGSSTIPYNSSFSGNVTLKAHRRWLSAIPDYVTGKRAFNYS